MISDPAQMSPFLNEPRRRFHVPALAVVRPKSVSEVQTVMRFAHAHDLPVIPQGGNTGLVGAQVPLSGREVILSLTHLNAVRDVDPTANHMTIEAGATLQSAHEIAADAGKLFPLFIASQGSAQIGGVLSSNAGGIQVLAYGNARALCLGVEAVLADGRLYQGLGSLKKDNTGYDLKDLLVGAEGTLGIITAATLKLFPQPALHETALIGLDSPEMALKLFNFVQNRLGQMLTAFELMPRIGLEIQLRHKMIAADPLNGATDWSVMLEASLPHASDEGLLANVLGEAMEAGLAGEHVVMAQSETQRQEIWAIREQMSECQRHEGASIKHDVSVPVAHIPDLITQGIEAVAQIDPEIRPVPFGHMGDGNIHFNFSQPVGADPKAFMAGAEPVHKAIYDIVRKLGGSVSAEHGIGQLKTELLAEVKDPVALDMMRAIKQALDPKGILNPGKVLKSD